MGFSGGFVKPAGPMSLKAALPASVFKRIPAQVKEQVKSEFLGIGKKKKEREAAEAERQKFPMWAMILIPIALLFMLTMRK